MRTHSALCAQLSRMLFLPFIALEAIWMAVEAPHELPSIWLAINESDLYTLMLHTVAAQLNSTSVRSRRGKVNMKTLIIWENLRNCVFHVTFYYLLLFLLHTKHALIVRLAPEVFLLLQRINRTRYGFFHHDRGRWKSTNERNWLLRRGVLCAMRKAPGLWIISVRHPKVI